jgi:hypothetical protein
VSNYAPENRSFSPKTTIDPKNQSKIIPTNPIFKKFASKNNPKMIDSLAPRDLLANLWTCWRTPLTKT